MIIMKNLFLFKEWLGLSPEAKFGFAPSKLFVKKPFYTEEPMEPLRSTYVLDELVKMGRVNSRIPLKTWANIVEYGNDTGGLHVSISPLGSFKIIIRKYINDSNGNIVPICKDVIPLLNDFNHKGDNDPSEIVLANDLHHRLSKIDTQTVESINKNYNKLEELVIDVAKSVKASHPAVMSYGGVVKVEEHTYMIWLEYKGYGNGVPNSQKGERFSIYLQYKPEKGLIHSWACEVTSPVKQRLYISTPSEWDELFSPSQPHSEITKCIMEILSTY